MVTLEDIILTINQFSYEDKDDLLSNIEDDIIVAFDDYSYAGETDVIVSENVYDSYTWQAYINHEDSPIILIEIDEDDSLRVAATIG